MQFQQIKPKTKVLFVFVTVTLLIQIDTMAQVNSVEFEKNRVQYRKFKWEYYQTTNFNTYFYEDGKAIANYVAQIAEEELPAIEQFVEYGLQRRANVVLAERRGIFRTRRRPAHWSRVSNSSRRLLRRLRDADRNRGSTLARRLLRRKPRIRVSVKPSCNGPRAADRRRRASINRPRVEQRTQINQQAQ